MPPRAVRASAFRPASKLLPLPDTSPTAAYRHLRLFRPAGPQPEQQIGSDPLLPADRGWAAGRRAGTLCAVPHACRQRRHLRQLCHQGKHLGSTPGPPASGCSSSLLTLASGAGMALMITCQACSCPDSPSHPHSPWCFPCRLWCSSLSAALWYFASQSCASTRLILSSR